MGNRKFYAAYHRYGTEFANDYDTLYRFDSKEARDEFVSDSNFDESATGSTKTEAVTRAEAVRHFPKAFRVLEYHDEPDARDWHILSMLDYWCRCW